MFSVENFLSRSAENFREESFSASLFSGIEKFYASERGEVVSRFSVENVFVSRCRKFP